MLGAVSALPRPCVGTVDVTSKKGTRGCLSFSCLIRLLDLGLLLQPLLEFLQLALLQRFSDLALHLVEGRQLRVAHFFELDHVVAELRLHRGLRDFACLQRSHRLRERLYERILRCPAEIAAIGCRQGMEVGGDVESLGRGVTSAVVQAIFATILIDAIFAVIYMKLDL